MRTTLFTALLLTTILAVGAAHGAIVYTNFNHLAVTPRLGTAAFDLNPDIPSRYVLLFQDSNSQRPEVRGDGINSFVLARTWLDTNNTTALSYGGLPLTPGGVSIDANMPDANPGKQANGIPGLVRQINGYFVNRPNTDSDTGGSSAINDCGDWGQANTNTAYIGLMMVNGGSTNFGWAHFTWSDPSTNSTEPNAQLILLDGACETTASKSILAGDSGAWIQNPATDSAGHPTFGGSGIAGVTYGVERALNLAGPWVDAGTTTAAANGSWSFIDTSLTNPVVSFYRLSYPYPASSMPSEVMLLGFMMGPQWTGRDASGTGLWDTNATWGVPCPYDTNSIGGAPATWWYDTVAKNARILATNGFTGIWLPSPAKGNMGMRGPYASPTWAWGGIFDSGYGLFDDYDLGDKLQEGNYQTRYGSREQLNRCLAMLRANGLSAHLDLVLNQRNSPNISSPSAPAYQWFAYKDAYGNPNGGRFPKYWPDFHPGSGPPANHASPGGTEDPDVPATTYPDGSSTGKTEGFWGPDLAHVYGQSNINGVPGVWCDVQLKSWGDWLVRSLGVQGYRLDAASGISWDWLKDFVNYRALSGKFAVAELVGMPYNSYQMRDWMRQCMKQSGGNFTMFDQLLEPALGAMCNTSGFWMGALQSKYLSWSTGGGTNAMDPSAGSADPGPLDIYRSVMSVNPSQVVSVVNEVDTDTPVLGNPPSAVGPDRCLLGYAYIMTIGFGTPCVDWKDWSTDAGCYGGRTIQGRNLQYWLNNLIWCKKFVTTGGFGREQISSNGHVYGFERTGGSKALVFLNSNQGAAEKITFATSIPNGTQLQDYSGHTFSPVTISGGSVVVTVPANANGRGYLILAGPGKSGSFSPTPSNVTQQWEANTDLSIPPASGTRREVCRVWVDKGQTLAASLVDFNTTNWTENTQLILEIDQSSLDNSSNTAVSSRSFTSSMKGETLVVTNTSSAPSFYSLFISGRSLPFSGGPWWFKLQNTYTASQTAPTSFDDPSTCYH